MRRRSIFITILYESSDNNISLTLIFHDSILLPFVLLGGKGDEAVCDQEEQQQQEAEVHFEEEVQEEEKEEGGQEGGDDGEKQNVDRHHMMLTSRLISGGTPKVAVYILGLVKL